VLGLSFYPLEQAPNMVIYAMSKSGTATSGLILVAGLFTQAPFQTRAVAAKKFICDQRKGWKVSLDYLAEYIIKPSFSGVVCPVDKRHKSIAKRRAA
jgi:hypothetical protein